MRPRTFNESAAPRLLPHLAEPIDAYTLSVAVHSTASATTRALNAMRSKGLVRRIVRRTGGTFVAHLWIRT